MTTRQMILVADPDRFTAEAMAMRLRESGFGVRAFTDADLAWAEFTRTRPDLVVCDRDLVLSDGVRLERRIGLHPAFASIPIILVGEGMPTSGHEPTVTHLRKPLRGIDLIEACRVALDGPPRASVA